MENRRNGQDHPVLAGGGGGGSVAAVAPGGARVRDQDRQPDEVILREIINGNRRQLYADSSVIEYEDALTPLQLHIENGEWEEALERIKSHPDEILPTTPNYDNISDDDNERDDDDHHNNDVVTSGRKLTALHLACEGGECPLDVITAMLQQQPKCAAMVDKDGNTALHNACAGQFAYNPYVLAVLLAAFPQAVFMKETVDQSTPLHLLLVLGGNVNIMCLTLLLDVAYSPTMASVIQQQQQQQKQEEEEEQIDHHHHHHHHHHEMTNGFPSRASSSESLSSASSPSLELYPPICTLAASSSCMLPESLLLAAKYPPTVLRLIQQLAQVMEPASFPVFLRPFLYLTPPSTLDLVSPQQQRMMLHQQERQRLALTVQQQQHQQDPNKDCTKEESDDPCSSSRVVGTIEEPARKRPRQEEAQNNNNNNENNKKKERLLLMKESKGQTPLHSACARALKTEVIRVLTNEARYEGAHDAVKTREHNKDRYPFFYAACYGCPGEALKLLFDIYPPAVHHVESYRILPVQVAFISPNYSNQDRRFELKNGPRKSNREPIEGFFVRKMAYRQFRTIELVLRMTYHNSHNDPPPAPYSLYNISSNSKRRMRLPNLDGSKPRECFRTVHAAAAVPQPPSFLRCAIQLNPWQLQEQDEEGNLPLHIACRIDRRTMGGIDSEKYFLRRGVNQARLFTRCLPEDRPKDNPVAILVEASPKAAECVNEQGSLPLHLAILGGKGMIDGIQTLVRANPGALSTLDGEHHLYPFLLAAMKRVSTLELTYELLLANPAMVQSGIVKTIRTI